MTDEKAEKLRNLILSLMDAEGEDAGKILVSNNDIASTLFEMLEILDKE